jgi:hypothetical protein
MPSCLIETFLTRDAAAERQARERGERSAVDAMARSGARVPIAGSIDAPEDEVRFYTVEATPGAEIAAQRAGSTC